MLSVLCLYLWKPAAVSWPWGRGAMPEARLFFDIQNRCLILTNTTAYLSLPHKNTSLTLSPQPWYWHSRKSPKAAKCAAGTAGRPHPKANLDRWRAKQRSTSGHVSSLCCSFLNPTLNGSAQSLLADIQGRYTGMSLRNAMAIFSFLFW